MANAEPGLELESGLELAAPFPTPGRDMPTKMSDAREKFVKITKKTPRDRKAEEAFLATKSYLIRTDPHLDRAERVLALDELTERVGKGPLEALAKKRTPPVPGGVGYGLFYTNAFKSAFYGGTSMYFEIVCPQPPGGNVNTWLYLTGMNRAGRGIEAFVSYNAQTEPHFKVFDWARSDHWQTDCPFGALGSYLGNVAAHGSTYRALGVWNSTYQIAAGQWRNEALLWNRSARRWDLLYRYDYSGTQAEQISGWTGSWGPIVETFQSPYQNTSPFGALSTMLISRGSSGAWGSWQFLSAANSSIRNDNQGFYLVFLDPNYAFVVDS
jgi:hypothetical protein